jgi:tripartite-type tricarboxylate transporter receptor subunit TctC
MKRFAVARPPSWLALAALVVASCAWAQSYPSHPVRIVIPLSPGGTTDVPGRMVAQKLSETLGQQFFVENKAGAGGMIGSDFASPPDPTCWWCTPRWA